MHSQLHHPNVVGFKRVRCLFPVPASNRSSPESPLEHAWPSLHYTSAPGSCATRLWMPSPKDGLVIPVHSELRFCLHMPHAIQPTSHAHNSAHQLILISAAASIKSMRLRISQPCQPPGVVPDICAEIEARVTQRPATTPHCALCPIHHTPYRDSPTVCMQSLRAPVSMVIDTHHMCTTCAPYATLCHTHSRIRPIGTLLQQTWHVARLC